MQESIILTGFLASLAAGLMTAVGSLPIFGMGKLSAQQQNVLLGFAAGVMLAASFFSLIIPGIEQAEAGGASKAMAATIVLAAVMLGALTISALDSVVPPLDQLGLGPRGIADARFRRIWLFIAAITLHNLPEGLAVGVSFGGGDMGAGTATALGIGLQNMPEGLAVAVSLVTLGYRRRTAFLLAMASGLVEPLGGVIGVVVTSMVTALLPWGLGFAAGAMIFVVASEILPDIHRKVGNRLSSLGLMVGLVAMIFLDVTFG